MPHALRAIGALISLACLGFFALSLQRSWHAITAVPWSIALIAYAVPTLLLYLATHALAAGAWQCALRALDGRLSYTNAAGIMLVSQFAKYAPGNVGQYVGRVLLAQRAGLPPRVALSSLVIETGTIVLAACICSLAALDLLPLLSHRYGADAISVAYLAIATLMALLVAACVVPTLRRRAVSALDQVMALLAPAKLRLILEALSLHSVNFVLGALALRTLIAAVPGQDATTLAPLLGVYAIAWLCGFLVVGAPAGLGVREAVLLLGLAPMMSPEKALVATLGLRMITTVGDGCAALIGLGLRFSQPPARGSGSQFVALLRRRRQSLSRNNRPIAGTR